ncbi:hypothetical protein BSPA111_28710 [Buttiauxella sp. A111]|nr:hypothetical protein BSPA111_28710 [Buttiauxella sp. A111]
MMEEGYYWIQFEGQVQIARYFSQNAEDFETGERVSGGWELFGVLRDIIHTSAVEVLSPRLQPPT